MNDRYEINTNSFFFFYTIQYIHSSFVHVSERRQRSQKICSFRNILFVSENNAQKYLAILGFQYVLRPYLTLCLFLNATSFLRMLLKISRKVLNFLWRSVYPFLYLFSRNNLKTIHTATINKRLRGRLAYSTNSFEIYTQ